MWRTGHLGSQETAKTKILDLMKEWQVGAQEETEGNSASKMLTKIKGMEYAGVGARVSLGKADHFQGWQGHWEVPLMLLEEFVIGS